MLAKKEPTNVIGEPLEVCGKDPVTGFFRDGCCNDLTEARPEFGFPGLKAGDGWCLCAGRWREALDAGCAPRVRLKATHRAALEVCDLADLKKHSVDLS
jgi:uncharacterized protein (DUF2237 family)